MSRLKGVTVVHAATNPTGEGRLDLLALLGELAPGVATLEIEVLVGDQVRLPAKRVPREAADERRRKLRLDAKRRQLPAGVSEARLALANALDEPALLPGVLKTIAGCLAAGCWVAKRRKEPGTAQQLLALTGPGEEAAIA